MAINPILNKITTGFNLSKINENFDLIVAALKDAVSRSASSPNTMTADLDMNSQQLINLGPTTMAGHAVSKAHGDANYGGAVTTAAAASAAAAAASAAAIDAKITISTLSPTGGVDGDIWFKTST